jgi:hypothetical protein
MPDIPEGATPFSDVVTTADATSGVVLKAGEVGKQIFITDLVMEDSDKDGLVLRDDTGDIVYKMFFPATQTWQNTWEFPITVAIDSGVRLFSDNVNNMSITISGYVI